MVSTSVSVADMDYDLIRQIKDGSLKIAIYGLGHVGSPLAAAWLRAGAHVIGRMFTMQSALVGKQFSYK